MIGYKLKKSNRKGKLLMVEINGKKIHFGSDEHEQYTTTIKKGHHDDERKRMYHLRHKKTNDIMTAQFWSNNLLWEFKSMREAIKYLHDKFDLKPTN